MEKKLSKEVTKTDKPTIADDKKANDDKSKDKEEKKEEAAPQTVQMMTKGDYTVHILVEEIKNLLGKEEDCLVLPSVKLTVFKRAKRTNKLKTGCFSYTFSEHFYFEKDNLSLLELDSEKIFIEVIDLNNTNREDYIGIFEFDFTYIYNHKDHCINNFWIALANPESNDIAKVRGYLKLSISVLNATDPRVELCYKSLEDPNALCMIPPQVKMEYMQISIYFLKAEQLPDMDSLINPSKVNRECNGFIHTKYQGLDVKTSVKDMKNDVIIWNEVIELPVSIPVVSQKILMQVFDKDAFSDDIIGSFEVNMDDILANRYKNLQYIPLYGAPVYKTGLYSEKMNANPEIGSLWKGRILMKINYEKTDNPKKSFHSIKDEAFLKEAGKLGKINQWFLDIFLYDAYFLPEESSEYAIHICVEEQIFKFPLKKANKRNISYNLSGNIQLQTLSNNIKDLSDLFIYLCNSSKEYICFQRLKLESFYDKDDIVVVKLFPDPSVGKIGEFVDSGIVKINIKIRGKEVNIPINNNNKVVAKQNPNLPNNTEESDEEEGGLMAEMNKMKQEIKKKPVEKGSSYMIIANIHMSRFLIAGDSNGTSDPFVKLRIGEIEKKTSTKYDSINCIWNETLIFENVNLEIEDKSTWPIMFMRIMDKDNFKDDMLAYNYIWLSDSSYAINDLPKLIPSWNQMHMPVSNRPQGQILCSFYIIDSKRTDLINIASNLDIYPETVLYSCEINLLGLRDLKPLSIMPVKKAFISFDLNSINVSGKDDTNLKTIKTQPKKSGANPTINTVIKFDIKLPKDDIFMPDMQCVVYDYILAGLVNQMLGVFVVPLREIIAENEVKIKRDLKVTQQKLGLYLIDGQNHAPIDEVSMDDINLDESNNINVMKSYTAAGNQKSPLQENNSDQKNLLKNEQRKEYKLLQDDQNDVVIELNEGKDPREIKVISNNNENPNPKINNQTATVVVSVVNAPRPDNNNDFIVRPVYKKYILPGNKPGSKNYKEFEIEDDSLIPSNEFYEAVGFNKYIQDNKKHYRRRFNCNLEDATDLGLKSPFYKLNLRRGKFIDQTEETGMFEALTDKHNKIIKRFKSTGGHAVDSSLEKISKTANVFFDNKVYGDFKGLIRIVEKSKMKEYHEVVESIRKKDQAILLKDFKYLTNFEDISKRILVEKEVVVRIYILNLGDLAKKDLLSESDPFLNIFLGGNKIDESKNAKSDTANCSWCKFYDMTTILPGDGMLKIDVWDYDPLFSDELIGTTVIDIEDRFFDNKWQNLTQKPIERRNLYHPDLEGPQGWITLWVEVFEKKDRARVHKWDISPPPTVELEMRLIVWETEDTVVGDVEGMSDYYVTAFIDNNNKQSTDVHFRCEEGKSASFNWRIVIPITAPRENTKLNIQLMDNDFFSKDDYLAGSVFELGRLIKDVYALDVPIKFEKDFFDALNPNEKGTKEIEFKTDENDNTKFWLQLYKQGQHGVEKGGRVLLSLEILPHWKAQVCKVGKGRDEPNVNPYLPAPLGRFNWSLNPISMLNQCVAARFRRKFYCLVCVAALIMYLIFVIPYVILHLTGEAANPFNYTTKK